MSVNKVILVGNVGKDPEVKHYDSGQSVASFSLATTERAYILPNGTQVPERTDWHYIVANNRFAQIVDRYVHKGDKLYIEGKLRTRSYTDKTGSQRYITEVYVDSLELFLPRTNNSDNDRTPL